MTPQSSKWEITVYDAETCRPIKRVFDAPHPAILTTNLQQFQVASRQQPSTREMQRRSMFDIVAQHASKRAASAVPPFYCPDCDTFILCGAHHEVYRSCRGKGQEHCVVCTP